MPRSNVITQPRVSLIIPHSTNAQIIVSKCKTCEELNHSLMIVALASDKESAWWKG